MINKDFAIGTYEINLMTDNERTYMFDNLLTVANYIDTAINYNNDYLLQKYSATKIISKIAACHVDDYEFFVTNHLKCLNRDNIDIMLIHSNRGDWQELAKIMCHDKRFGHVGVSNFNTFDLEQYKRITGIYPEYNEIEINPMYVDVETINFCKTCDIKIIAYCIFGGKYNAMSNIAKFSVPYLIAFAANYADIVIIRTDSERQTNAAIDAIKNYTLSNTVFAPIENSKSMQPMKYSIPNIQKQYCNERTYFVDCGKNTTTAFVNKHQIRMQYPVYEMLGDYMTKLRYTYRQDYSSDVVYDKDFLIGDNGKYYVVYLIENGMLTKVNNENVCVETYELEHV